MTKKQKKYTVIFSILAIVFAIAYLFVWVYTQRDLISEGFNENSMYIYLKIIKRRSIQLLAIFISTILIATSSLTFQTVTRNRILTPSVLGFDSIFIVTQTLLVALLGVASIGVSNIYVNFIIATTLMIFIILLMYRLVLRKNKNNIILLLLLGMVITSLAGSISNFLQVFMHPEDYQSVQGLTTVSLTNISEPLILVSIPFMIIVVVLFFRKNKIYDVMALGEDQANNLGVDYNKESKTSLIYIAIAVAISTALIGPLSFLGLIAVNSAREIFKTNKHTVLYIASSIIGFSILMLGQIIVELLGNTTSVSVLISLIGGAYMIYLIIKENQYD